ncbi:MAG: carboxypeptidase regulatory-like domain-containing protein, partial [Acidobacteriota bacterium]|nr:carboxypeptidase regulatory-like domain-containing protein [Acidobacteriota bacterium]
MKRKLRTNSRPARSTAPKSPLKNRRSKLFRNSRARLAALLAAVAVAAAIALSTISLAQQKVVLRSDPVQSPASPASIPAPGRNAAERSSSERDKESKDSKGRSSRRRARQQDGNADGAHGRGGDRNHPDPRPKAFRLVRAHSFDGDLRNLPDTKPEKKERPEREGPDATPGVYVPPAETSQETSSEAAADSNAPAPSAPNAPSPGPTASFEGLDFANWGAGHPPDTNGDVGKDYYIQTINTSIGIFRKSDGVRVAAFTFNTFMSQGHFGNLCDTNNFGDPVVLYDTFEDRWIITDFAFKLDSGGNVVNPPGAFQCFAASKTSDPVSGGWNFYSINTAGGLGDYPKLGIWPDGLYMSVNMFGYAANASFLNSRVYALNKAQMYAGEPTVQVVSFDAPAGEFTLLPSNARLQTGTPPPGSPNYFAVVWQFLNVVSVYKFHVDWNSVSTSTFTGPFQSVTPTWWAQYSNASATTIPSPANRLDSLYPRLMMQNQYTNIGGVESLWDSHTVGAGNPTSNVTSAQAAVRYYQVKVTNGNVEPSATQSFTYSPDSTFRFMPSTAVDRGGDMAIGYSASSSTLNPAIRYAGRLGTDAVNTITQAESSLIEGGGTQSGPCNTGGTGTCTRWGDYSAMSVDTDGCTFWYTNMYYAANGNNHHTRIGSFKFPQCVPSLTGGVQGQVTASPGGSPIAGATVALGSRTTTTDAGGNYSFSNLPSGTYPSITASFPGYTSSTTTSVAVGDGATTVVNFALAGAQASSCLLDTAQADFQTGVPSSVDLTSSPGNVTLLNAENVDQSNTTLGTSGFGVTTTQWLGQTFTPAVTGTLTKLDINLFCASCTGSNPPVTIDVRTTSGGLPTSTIVASTTVPGFSSGASGFYTATFSSPPTLTSGTTYAIMARLTTARTAGNYDATFSAANPYSRGVLVFTTNGGTSFSSIAGDDLGFRTYMKTGFASSGNLVSGLK